jgi:beta-aspartyl-peptidase (threonine type)
MRSAGSLLSFIGLVLMLSAPQAEARCKKHKTWALLVHGGAGTGNLSRKDQEARRKVIMSVLMNNMTTLKSGGSALDAVEAAIRQLEDSPIFNAGRGGIPNKAGFVELDASIMRGDTLDAGAVAAVRTVKNPISAARAAMEKSEHLLFVDRGAMEFARKAGLEMVEPDYFLVPRKKKGKGKGTGKGTVGAVALDRCGNLVAGTSTGGYSTKTPGRVGDSPIIGAGTYANNATCAVSATGWGEFFIRYAAAHDVSALVEYKGLGIQEAAETVLKKLKKAGATGGFIVVDTKGRMAWPYTSKGMIRGYVNHLGKVEIGVMEKMDKPF